MSLRGALPKLTAADVEALASPTAPRLSSVPGARLGGSTRELGPRPPRPSRRTPAHRAADRAPVTSRRLRRYFNDEHLVSTAAENGALPTTRAEFRALFEPETRTMFARLGEDSTFASAWAPFVDVDEEGQDRLMKALCVNGRTRLEGKNGGNLGKRERMEKERKINAEEMLRRVDGRIRYLFKMRPAVVRPLVKQVEETVVGLERGESLVLRLPDAMGRMVAHGVAQFHCLGHRSLGVGSERVLVVCGKGRPSQGEARLVDVLA